MMIDLGDTSSFLSFDPSVGQIKMINDDYSILSEHTGSYKIKYQLTDSLDKSIEFYFLVNVVCF